MFNGPEYKPKHDYARLRKQIDRIKFLMLDGEWRTLFEIEELTNDPPASISAQLRHLRKIRFGGFIVNRRSRGDRDKGLFEYQVKAPDERHIKKLKKKKKSITELEKEVQLWKKRAIRFRRKYELCEAKHG